MIELFLIFFIYFQLIFNQIKICSDDYICIKEYDRQYWQIICYKDNKEIQKFKRMINLKGFDIGHNKVCYSNDQIEILCETFDSQIEKYDTSIQISDDDFSKKYTDIIVKENQICAYNNYNIKCFGSPLIKDNIPTELRSGNYFYLIDIQGSKQNVCVLAKYSNFKLIKSQICFGDTSSGINIVPKSLTNLTPGIITIYSMGIDTICVIVDLQPDLSQCWGQCPADLCSIPQNLLNESVLKISVGYTHACIVNYHKYKNANSFDMGTLSCWGGNEYGQLSVPSSFLNQITEVATNKHMTCGLKQNGEMSCWGIKNELFPSLSNKLKSISTGGRHTCGIFRGQQECWGNDEQGQLELGDDNSFDQIKSISAGWDFTCQYGNKDMINCVGFNQQGQIDVPTKLNEKFSFGLINRIQSGLSHSCVLQYNIFKKGRLQCWGGQNEHSELDVPNTGVESDVLMATVGNDFTCQVQINNDFHVYQVNCFGNNDNGQSIDLDIKQVNLREISGGGAHACLISGLQAGRSIQCWGRDSNGQVQVPAGLKQVNSLALGDGHSCVVEWQSGDVVCWGGWEFRQQELYPQSLNTAYEQYCVVSEYETGLCFGDNEWGQCDVPKYPKLIL